MDILTIFFYLVSALVLFFILNYFDKAEKENNVIHVVIPVIYEVLLAGFFTSIGLNRLNDNLFMVVIIELLIRLCYVKNILRREDLLNTTYYVQIYGISIFFCYLVNSNFISEVNSVFPSAEEMRVGVWLLIILFIYFVLKKHVHFQYKEQQSTFASRKQEYILVQYTRFKNQYQKSIKLKEKELFPLVYAMMIYENYRRPAFFRKIDLILYRFTGSEKKLGIMQISTRSEINDLDSIKMSVKRIEKIVEKIGKKSKKNIISNILEEYYSHENYIKNIQDIYEKIIEFDEL